jgi:hypothetical protein
MTADDADDDPAASDPPADDADAGDDDAPDDVTPASDSGTRQRDSGERDGAGSASAGEPLSDLRDRVVDDSESGAHDRGDDADGTGHADGPGDSVDGQADVAVEDDRSGPLGDVAAGIDERRQRKTKTDEELFESMDVGEFDSEALWEQVESDDPVESRPRERVTREIDKHKYCQKCPHFSTPPDVHCTHEGTDILEQIGMETFAVADCPIILEDERLENVTTD